jgi:hypothetical protein
MRRDGTRAEVANLIDVAFAAGMHALADGTLASQFLDVSQETLDGLVLEGSGVSRGSGRRSKRRRSAFEINSVRYSARESAAAD